MDGNLRLTGFLVREVRIADIRHKGTTAVVSNTLSTDFPDVWRLLAGVRRIFPEVLAFFRSVHRPIQPVMMSAGGGGSAVRPPGRKKASADHRGALAPPKIMKVLQAVVQAAIS